MDEFELITRCFRARAIRRHGTVLGIGDDASLLDTGGLPLAHARATAPFAGSDTGALTARRAFGAAFIRLAAQAATPRWATLGLTLEAGDPDWVEGFAAATGATCEACGVELIGGDTTRGPGRATVFALGTGSALPHEPAPARGAEIAVRLSLEASTNAPMNAPTNAPEHALADVVATCAALAARGTEIRCNESPEAGETGCALEVVARTDAEGLRSLHAVAERWQLLTTNLDESA